MVFLSALIKRRSKKHKGKHDEGFSNFFKGGKNEKNEKKIIVGDEVKLKRDLIIGNYYGGICLLPGMKAWFDKHKTAFVIGTAMGTAWFKDNKKSSGSFFYSFEILEKV